MNESATTAQERLWTLNYYSREYKEGWLMLLHESFDALRRLFKRSPKQLANGPSGPQNWPQSYATTRRFADVRLERVAESEELSSVSYGIKAISKMLDFISLYMPAFVLDARPGLAPTEIFSRVSYFLLLFSVPLSSFIIKKLIEPTLMSMLPAVIKPVTKLLANVAILSQNMIVIFGNGCLIAIIYLRRPLQDFVLYQCNMIWLPRSYQRRKAVELLATFYILTLFSKPAFVTLMLTLDSYQPRQLLHWSPPAFMAARWLIISAMSVSSSIICFAAMVIPLITTYLIVCAATYLNRSVQKQITRFSRVNRICSRQRRNLKRNQELERLLDDKTRHLIDDYSCDTLTCDWPDLITSNDSDQSDAQEESKSYEALPAIKSNAPSLEENKNFDPPFNEARTDTSDYGQHSAGHNSTSSGLLFIHKNLIKILSSLKGMITIYERRLGAFHLLQICVDSLIVAFWITTSLTEMRLKDELKTHRLANRTFTQTDGTKISNTLDSERPSNLVWLTCMSAISFVLMNTYIFMTCDCLPDSMVKMRSKLFKMNIDLGQSTIAPSQRRLEPAAEWRHDYSRLPSLMNTKRQSLSRSTNLGSQPRDGQKERGFRRRSRSKLVPSDDCSAVFQVWSLYDQVVRLSELANFRLTSGTYYSKRCLLWIFGRTVSVTLLCIQIVDIYSYSR